MMTNTAVRTKGLLIPLIDFSKFIHGAPAERESTARELLLGFQTAGFVYLEKHPIAPWAMRQAFSHARAFFAQPDEAKQALNWTCPDSNRGYAGIGRETVTFPDAERMKQGGGQELSDIKETYNIGTQGDARFPNLWPEENHDNHLVGFQAFIMDFFHQCDELHSAIIRALCLALGLDERFADPVAIPGNSILRLLHYPALDNKVFEERPQQTRARPHSDYGLATLLIQDSLGGLQVIDDAGNFVDATPIENTIVVNAGDLLQRWSNDLIKSTVHRVVQPPRETGSQCPDRYSIALFGNPNTGAVIETLPGTYTSEKGIKYESVVGSEWVLQRLRDSY